MSKTIKDITLTQTTMNDTDYFEIQEDAGTSKKLQASVLAAYSQLPVGSSIDYSGTVVPTNWMVEDGSSLLRASYASLYSTLTTDKGTVTMTSANPGVVSLAAHGFITGDCISFTTTGALPTAITASTNYYVIYKGTGDFYLATTYANALANTRIDTTAGTQSGVHTLTWNPWGIASATTFYLPDTRGLSTEGFGIGAVAPAYNPWSTVNYYGGLGQYRQDTMQGHKLQVDGGTAGAGGGTGVSTSLGVSSTPSIGMIVTDGTRGTPRIDYLTSGPRVGKYKIIKVI